MKNRLREIRERKGLTQKELADVLGTSNASISRLETSDASSILKLARAAEVLGVSLTDLFVDRPEEMSELEAVFMSLPETQRRIVLDLASSLAKASTKPKD